MIAIDKDEPKNCATCFCYSGFDGGRCLIDDQDRSMNLPVESYRQEWCPMGCIDGLVDTEMIREIINKTYRES